MTTTAAVTGLRPDAHHISFNSIADSAKTLFGRRAARMVLASLAIAFLAPTGTAFAADAEFTLTLKDHIFTPATLAVPAGTRIRLTVKNEDTTTEEFESRTLHVEKIVLGGKSITVTVGPLDAGNYEFVGEFHEDTAKGTLVAK